MSEPAKVIRWEEPPPRLAGRPTRWDAVLCELKTRPIEWGRIAEGKSFHWAGETAAQLRKRYGREGFHFVARRGAIYGIHLPDAAEAPSLQPS